MLPGMRFRRSGTLVTSRRSVVESDDPPLMLVLGTDALQAFRGTLDGLQSDLASCESVGAGRNFSD